MKVTLEVLDRTNTTKCTNALSSRQYPWFPQLLVLEDQISLEEEDELDRLMDLNKYKI